MVIIRLYWKIKASPYVQEKTGDYGPDMGGCRATFSKDKSAKMCRKAVTTMT